MIGPPRGGLVLNVAVVVLLLLLTTTSSSDASTTGRAAAFAPSCRRSSASPSIDTRKEWVGAVGTDPAVFRPSSSGAASSTYASSAARRRRRRSLSSSTSTPTALAVLLDVPDGFFTITFPVLGILLGISKSFARVRMEENAWEQRLAEGRAKLMAQDPTLTELDLRRMEAEREWSAYGVPRMQQQEREQEERFPQQKPRRRPGATTKEGETRGAPSGVMSVEEIEAFEATYGVEYDPYYDDPYEEDELPLGKYQVDKRYGDRIYDDGEVFYKTSDGTYYRQGAKPRSIQFW